MSDEMPFGSAAVADAPATLSEMTSRAQDQAAKVASRVQDKASEFGHQATEKMGATADYFREHQMRDIVGDLQAYARAHPTTALLGAFAIAVLAVVVLRRS